MVDAAQSILIFVVVLLTVLLVILGIQVYFILKELRKTVKKANRVLDNTSIIAESVSGPVSSFSSLASSFHTGGAFIKVMKKIVKAASSGKESDE